MTAKFAFVATNNITGKRYADHLREAGFEVETIPNQGRGAAAMRIEAVRRLAPKYWFNEATTEAGRDALGFYHEKRDETRNIGLGPEHDWSSHAADSFGLMAVRYQPPAQSANFNRALTPVYRFRYIGNPVFHIGLMAQDVESDTPEAVIEIGGIKTVDYKAATDRAVAARGHESLIGSA